MAWQKWNKQTCMRAGRQAASQESLSAVHATPIVAARCCRWGYPMTRCVEPSSWSIVARLPYFPSFLMGTWGKGGDSGTRVLRATSGVGRTPRASASAIGEGCGGPGRKWRPQGEHDVTRAEAWSAWNEARRVAVITVCTAKDVGSGRAQSLLSRGITLWRGRCRPHWLPYLPAESKLPGSFAGLTEAHEHNHI